MTVLVDDARWEWRGALWAHLVSDHSHEELHTFAQRLGKRRLGFQGDHYDIDHIDRERAAALGAEVVDSRQLVQRLRGAGLRRRGSRPAWEQLTTAGHGEMLGFPPLIAEFGVSCRRLSEAVLELGDLDARSRSAVFADDHQLVALLDIRQGDGIAMPSPPDADEVWIGHPRADGERSIEIFVTR